MRVSYAAFGIRGEVKVPKFAVQQAGEDRIHAVLRSLERKNHAHVCGVTPNGYEQDRQGQRLHYYQLTLGRHARIGGYNVIGRVNVAVITPREEPS